MPTLYSKAGIGPLMFRASGQRVMTELAKRTASEFAPSDGAGVASAPASAVPPPLPPRPASAPCVPPELPPAPAVLPPAPVVLPPAPVVPPVPGEPWDPGPVELRGAHRGRRRAASRAMLLFTGEPRPSTVLRCDRYGSPLRSGACRIGGARRAVVADEAAVDGPLVVHVLAAAVIARDVVGGRV